MHRRLLWVKQLGLSCWGCSDCSWLFNPTNIPRGESFDGIVRKFELQRDKAFSGHVCAKPPRHTGKQLSNSSLSIHRSLGI